MLQWLDSGNYNSAAAEDDAFVKRISRHTRLASQLLIFCCRGTWHFSLRDFVKCFCEKLCNLSLFVNDDVSSCVFRESVYCNVPDFILVLKNICLLKWEMLPSNVDDEARFAWVRFQACLLALLPIVHRLLPHVEEIEVWMEKRSSLNPLYKIKFTELNLRLKNQF